MPVVEKSYSEINGKYPRQHLLVLFMMSFFIFDLFLQAPTFPVNCGFLPCSAQLVNESVSEEKQLILYSINCAVVISFETRVSFSASLVLCKLF